MSHCSPWGWKVQCLSGWTASTMPVASCRSTSVCPLIRARHCKRRQLCQPRPSPGRTLISETDVRRRAQKHVTRHLNPSCNVLVRVTVASPFCRLGNCRGRLSNLLKAVELVSSRAEDPTRGFLLPKPRPVSTPHFCHPTALQLNNSLSI